MAQYSELTESEIGDACSLFGVDIVASAHMEGGAANTSYKISTADANFVLTVLDNTSHLKFPPEVLPETLEYLNANGVLTNKPRRSRDGLLIERVGEHQVMVKEYVDGNCYATLPTQYLQAAGLALGQLHTAPAFDALPAGARRLRNAEDFLPRFDDPEFANWVRQQLIEADESLPAADPVSIIHGDYASDNLVVTNSGNVAILDWETASLDSPIIDLGWAVVGLCCSAGRLEQDRLTSFLSGYQAVRSLDSADYSQLQHAAVYAATVLGFYRYVRQHIRFPNPAKFDIYREMWETAQDISLRWEGPPS